MTKAQEQALASLRTQGFAGRTFSAQEAFPGTTPQDNANRRVLDSLVRDGILTQGTPQELGHMAAGVAEIPASRERIQQAITQNDTATGREARQALEGWFQAKGINPKAMYDVPKARLIADEALQAKRITPDVHQHYHRHVLGVLQDSRSGVQMDHLAALEEKGPLRATGQESALARSRQQPLYQFAPQWEQAVQRERQTTLGHKAEQERGQEMGL